ncbi:DUF4391 domain-containing protein [Hathewaya massiliensis]|uniref:DUF4391 domain-containing protein n=1 Tax=Hathewaya massiliensis TaxID=1964382 RepID=UPI00115A680A|nr:DUF4391 domain-containing protein [Hathewaya massiliensis]
MFQFNSKTLVNKEFKLKEILKMINADKNLKNDASCIKKITLNNVISEATLNIKSDNFCKEIFIFKIDLEEKRIPLEFIKVFNRFMDIHNYFIFKCEGKFKELCIHRYVENDSIKFGNIYESKWKQEELKELPYCIKIREIYDNLIFNLVDLKPNENEELTCFLERFNNIQKIKKEISALEKKAFKETQPKKKFDMGREIIKQKEVIRTLEGDNNGKA